jgi:hypothetical protein
MSRSWAGHDVVIHAAWMASGVAGIGGDVYVTG